MLSAWVCCNCWLFWWWRAGGITLTIETDRFLITTRSHFVVFAQTFWSSSLLRPLITFPLISAIRSPLCKSSPSITQSTKNPSPPSCFWLAFHLPVEAWTAWRVSWCPFLICENIDVTSAFVCSFSRWIWIARASSTIDNSWSSSLPKAYSSSACRIRESISNVGFMSNFCSAPFKFLMAFFLFSASFLSRLSFCSFTGFSLTSVGGPETDADEDRPEGLSKPNCVLKLLKRNYLELSIWRSMIDSLLHDNFSFMLMIFRMRRVAVYCVQLGWRSRWNTPQWSPLSSPCSHRQTQRFFDACHLKPKRVVKKWCRMSKDL